MNLGEYFYLNKTPPHLNLLMKIMIFFIYMQILNINNGEIVYTFKKLIESIQVFYLRNEKKIMHNITVLVTF